MASHISFGYGCARLVNQTPWLSMPLRMICLRPEKLQRPFWVKQVLKMVASLGNCQNINPVALRQGVLNPQKSVLPKDAPAATKERICSVSQIREEYGFSITKLMPRCMQCRAILAETDKSWFPIWTLTWSFLGMSWKPNKFAESSLKGLGPPSCFLARDHEEHGVPIQTSATKLECCVKKARTSSTTWGCRRSQLLL